MAWVLGLWFADGNVMPPWDSHCGVARIGFIDPAPLQNILKHLQADHPIHVRAPGKNLPHPFYHIKICNQQIYEDLIRLGCIPTKSTVLKFPNVPLVYLPDFLRGYWEGDGSVSLVSRKKGCVPQIFCVFAMGSEAFAKAIIPQLHRLGIRGGTVGYYKYMGCWRVLFSVLDSVRIFHVFYDDCAPDMRYEAKYLKFVRCLQARSFLPGSTPSSSA